VLRRGRRWRRRDACVGALCVRSELGVGFTGEQCGTGSERERSGSSVDGEWRARS
jgi:hypothetical protein